MRNRRKIKSYKSKMLVFSIAALLIVTSVAVLPAKEEPRTLELVSKSTDGEIGNGDSGYSTWYPTRQVAVSGDGWIVAFTSEATNLDPIDDQSDWDVYIRNRSSGETTCISKLDQDLRNVLHVDISEDGRYVVYTREIFIEDKPRRGNELYVFDRYTEQTYWITEYFPYEVDYYCWSQGFPYPSISADGSRIAVEVIVVCQWRFISSGVWLYNCDYDNSSFCYSPVSQGYNADLLGGNYPKISGDGRYVAFSAYDLEEYIPGMDSDYSQVLVRNIETWALPVTLISANTNGDPGNHDSGLEDDIDISYDGRFVTFASYANDLVENDNNPYYVDDIFVRDRDPDENGVFDEGNGVTSLITVSIDDDGADRGSAVPCISADGHYVAFHSSASNLIEGDERDPDIFLRDRLLPRTTLISFSLLDPDPYAGSGGKGLAISANGKVIAFGSRSDLTEEDDGRYSDVYVNYYGQCFGDIDGDGDVDHSDLGILLSAWNSYPGDPNWNPNADLDENGHVGHSDLGILLANWGCGT